jgi:hypothetical protein
LKKDLISAIRLPYHVMQNQTRHAVDNADDTPRGNAQQLPVSGVPVADIQDFVKQPNVVIAVKIHDVTYVKQLKQSL